MTGTIGVAWERCTANDACTGVRIAPYSACLTHLEPSLLKNKLESLVPGSDVDVRGVVFGPTDHLRWLFDALRGDDRRVAFGSAKFDGAVFDGDVGFDDVIFGASASFSGVKFRGNASLRNTEFHGQATFCETEFQGCADFRGARFAGEVAFGGAFAGAVQMMAANFAATATFSGARFDGVLDLAGVTCDGDLLWRDCTFARVPRFIDATLAGEVMFGACTFEGHASLGPIGPLPAFSVEECVFSHGAVIEATAAEVSLRRSTFAGQTHVRLRNAVTHLDDAVFDHGCTLSSPDWRDSAAAAQSPPSGTAPSRPARVVSLRGVDCTDLVLADVDLSDCRFVGAYRLDKLRIEGDCRLMRVRGLWWLRRQMIADESDFRGLGTGRVRSVDGTQQTPIASPPTADQVASVYRQLRKGREDSKNEPGAADFYYGEMEMRRVASTTAAGEKVILTIYRLVSGYGLRATRAIAAFAALLAVTVGLLMAIGLPTGTVMTSESTGVVSPATGGQYNIKVTERLPRQRAAGSLRDRMSVARMERASRVALGAVVFRDSTQQLTVAGRYVELGARLLGPILLALALLAVRNRIKR